TSGPSLTKSRHAPSCGLKERGSCRAKSAATQGALRQAVRWGWLAANVARDARSPTIRRDEVNLPTPDQVLAAITAADEYDADSGVFVRLAAATGARRGEL